MQMDFNPFLWSFIDFSAFSLFLPPANEVCEGYVFTPVCQSFCSRVGGACWDTTPWKQTSPPEADTPQKQTPGTRHPPEPDTPRTRPPPEPDTPRKQTLPPAQCMLGDTVNKRAVCILLECNLVCSLFSCDQLGSWPLNTNGNGFLTFSFHLFTDTILIRRVKAAGCTISKDNVSTKDPHSIKGNKKFKPLKLRCRCGNSPESMRVSNDTWWALVPEMDWEYFVIIKVNIFFVLFWSVDFCVGVMGEI